MSQHMGRLSDAERLTLQQLRLLDWASRQDVAARNPHKDGEALGDAARLTPPSVWTLTKGVSLAPWQRAACDAWFASGGKGTIKVVTGAGKTIVALAIAERLQRQHPDLSVAIVVPTIVLMNQWHAALLERSNLPPAAIARVGGGHQGEFTGESRILISVLASARRELPRLVEAAGVGKSLLLIADECHRAGAPEMSAVLRTARRYSLGLSATPEREEDIDGMSPGYAESLLGHELGGIVYEMTFAQAIDEQVLPPFGVDHFGLPLSQREARQYEALTRSINDTRRELLGSSSSARKAGGDQFLAWARRVSHRGGGIGNVAARYVSETTRRKRLLYRAESRTAATVHLVQEALAQRQDARVILFHESIEEVVALFERLMRRTVPVVMEHSELPRDLRESSLELFRSGEAQVIVSARSLIEGFNVPEADLGIVVASSSSPRQRIQSIGRVLRRYRDAEGEQKTSRVCLLYVRDTVDEAIYEKGDWANSIGLDRNRYYLWDPPGVAIEQQGPPRAPVPAEAQIDVSALHPGEGYPGRYEGLEFSADSMGNVADLDGRIALNPQGVPATVSRLKGRPGRFKVTRQNRAILVLVPGVAEDWRTVFGGILATPFEFGDATMVEEVNVASLHPGRPYPGPIEPAQQLRFRQRAGGVIAKSVPRGETYARGAGADQLVAALRDVTRTRPISKIFVNELGHAFWREDGVPRFITALDERLEFPEQ